MRPVNFRRDYGRLQRVCNVSSHLDSMGKEINGEMLSEIFGSHVCEYEDGCLLGCCAV
jgi:hypothetical protein